MRTKHPDESLPAYRTDGPSIAQVAEEWRETNDAAHRVLRKAGFFPWGHDAWCHDLHGIGCVTTAEALDLLLSDDRLARLGEAR